MGARQWSVWWPVARDWNDWPLRAKAVVAVAIPLSALLVTALAFVLFERQARQADLAVAHTREVETEIGVLLFQSAQAATGVRGYLLTGETGFLAPYDQARRELPPSLLRLELLARQDPTLRARLPRIEALVNQELGSLASQRSSTAWPDDGAAASLRVEGNATLDELTAELIAIKAEEERLLAERIARVNRLNTLGLAVAGVGVPIGLIGGFLVALAIATGLIRRLELLERSAGELAHGLPLSAVPGGADEIGRLGRSLSVASALLQERERALQQANAQLETRVRERTAELSAANEHLARRQQELEPLASALQDQTAALERHVAELAETNRTLAQKNAENEMFVYSVSHDLRAPLVNLQGFSQELALVGQDLRKVLEDDAVPPAVRQRGLVLVDRDMATALRFIQTGVMRLSTIIDALLRLSRAGQIEYQWQSVDVQATVARIVTSLRDSIAARGARVTIGELPPAWGDPVAIEQIFANLLDNALKYLDPERPGSVEVGCRVEGAARVYFVRDNGLGIPDHGKEKAFQIFQRMHAGVGEGEGLGLALIKRIIERLSGKVWVESTVGTGSTFFVELHAPPDETLDGDMGVDREVALAARGVSDNVGAATGDPSGRG